MSQVFVIFGASGDLAQLKLYPALYELQQQRILRRESLVIGYARSSLTQEKFTGLVRASITRKHNSLEGQNLIPEFLQQVKYVQGQYDQAQDLKQIFELITNHFPTAAEPVEVVCYFSVPPSVFQVLIINLAQFNEHFKLKIVIEKPFGTDLLSAQELYHTISQSFREEQVFLLDHFLGKTSIQNILWLRQHNPILNLMLNGQNIQAVQISALETVGVEERLGFFDQVGTIRDMIQSHLMQLLALICMDLPSSSVSVPREKEHILSSVTFQPTASNLLLGQYSGYRDLDSKVADSRTETWAAVKLQLDRQDWHQVPVFLRTGKQLAEKKSQIVVEFRALASQPLNSATNKLILEFGPNERLTVQLNHARGVMNLSDTIESSPDGLSDYAVLFRDIFAGDHLHFVTFRQIIESWRVIDSILQYKSEHPELLQTYPTGSNPGFQNDIFNIANMGWN